MEIALSKPRMKALWRMYGISTPDWFTLRRLPNGGLDGIEFLENARDFPYFVKPGDEGNSRGIDGGSIVRSSLELLSRATLVAEMYGTALVERFVGGSADTREFTVAMIGSGTRALISAVEILKPSGPTGIVTQDDKDGHRTEPKPIEDGRLRTRVENLARRAFAAAGVRDYSRCDIIQHGGKLYAIEINGQPMVPDRWFEACGKGLGLDSQQYLQAIILAGIGGNARLGHAFIPVPPSLVRALPGGIVDQLAH
jgi:D-alanine-D-alanine ligase